MDRRRLMLGAGALLAGCATPWRTPPPVEEGYFVDVQGGRHWVRVRGDDRRNPVLLYVHGGPGAATSVWAWPYFRAVGWEQHFTLAHWDQPGAGHTFVEAGKRIPASVTMDSIASDGIAIARDLQRRLGKQKIVLMGGSWGSAIGLTMAHKEPSLFAAYVGTAQVVNKAEGEVIAYAQVLAKARQRNDEPAIRELTSSGAPPYASSAPFRVQRKWANAYEAPGASMPRQQAFAESGASEADLNTWLAGIQASEEHFVGSNMDGPWTRFDARTIARRFDLPMFFLHGAQDDIAPASLVEAYTRWIEAPWKTHIPIAGGGHNIDIRDTRVIDLLVKHVAPLTR
jgi:pimeloyl-ACP methyl ester carboxylesterase